MINLPLVKRFEKIYRNTTWLKELGPVFPLRQGQAHGPYDRLKRPLLLERLSILQCLTLWRHFTRSEVVYLHAAGMPRSEPATGWTRLVRTLIRLINPRVRIEAVPADILVAHNWESNRRAVEEVEQRTSEIEADPLYRVVRDLVQDDHILKFHKAMLAGEVAERRLFWAEARDLAARYGGLTVAPASEDPFPAAQRSQDDPASELSVTCRGVNRFRDAVDRMASLLVLIVVPIAFLLSRLRPGRRPNATQYDVAMPVLYGVDRSAYELTRVRSLRDDGSLYHDALPPGRIIHVFGAVRPRLDVEVRFKRAFETRGLPYLDWRDFAVTAGFAYKVLMLQVRLLQALARMEWRRPTLCLLRHAARALYWLLAYELEFEHVHAAVEVIRDDYAPRHVIKTILARRYGRKTVGIQHAAGIYDMPQLAFLHLDRYAVCAEGYVRTYQPHWNGLELERIGRESVDWITDIVHNPSRLQDVRDRLAKKYRPHRYTVVFALPAAIDPPPRAKWEELYKALEEFMRSSLDANVFLRFRRLIDIPTSPHLGRLVELAKKDDRLVLEHEDFTTYELMAVADLFIANSASFTVYEAIITGAKVFTFDFLGTGRCFYGSYGKDFLLETGADIIKTFNGLETGFRGFDCRLDQIRQDGDYHYDGRNLERFRTLVVQLAREADRSAT